MPPVHHPIHRGALAGLLLAVAGNVAAVGLSSLAPPAGVRLVGGTAGEESGTSVRFIGDVNGDGFDDVAVGAPQRMRLGVASAGQVYVLFGRSAPFTARDLDLGNVIGVGGLTMLGPSSGGSALGFAITPLGDFNGDGIDDFAVAGPLSSAAAVYIVFGSTSLPVSINLDASPSNYGRKITVPGTVGGSLTLGRANLNNDIFSDLVIGEFDRDVDGIAGSGRVTVVFGQAGGPNATVSSIDALTPTTSPRGVYFFPSLAGASLGRGIANLGDFNGDGVGDVALSAHNADAGGGRVYVVYGRNNTGPTALGFAGLENLATYTTAQGMRFDTAGVAGFASGRYGYAMDAADINGDGRRDLLAGALLYETPARAQSGAVVGIYGPGANAPTYARSLGTLLSNGAAFLMQGPRANGAIGWSVTDAGDLDGDGRADLAASTPIGAVPGFAANAGSTFTIYGRTSGSPYLPNGDLASLPLVRGTEWIGEAGGDNSGWSVSGGGDFNGDGRDDLLIGAPRADGTPGANSGITYLLLNNRRLVMFCDGLEAPDNDACGATN